MKISVRGSSSGHFFLWIIAERGEALTFDVLYLHFLNLAEKVGGKDEIIQAFVGRGKDICWRPFPLFMSFININHFLANSQYRVHIMRIDNGRHVIFLRNIMDQIINHL